MCTMLEGVKAAAYAYHTHTPTPSNGSSRSPKATKDACHTCGHTGHYSYACPYNKATLPTSPSGSGNRGDPIIINSTTIAPRPNAAPANTPRDSLTPEQLNNRCSHCLFVGHSDTACRYKIGGYPAADHTPRSAADRKKAVARADLLPYERVTTCPHCLRHGHTMEVCRSKQKGEPAATHLVPRQLRAERPASD
jgi:hypothetical protein